MDIHDYRISYSLVVLYLLHVLTSFVSVSDYLTGCTKAIYCTWLRNLALGLITFDGWDRNRSAPGQFCQLHDLKCYKIESQQNINLLSRYDCILGQVLSNIIMDDIIENVQIE